MGPRQQILATAIGRSLAQGLVDRESPTRSRDALCALRMAERKADKERVCDLAAQFVAAKLRGGLGVDYFLIPGRLDEYVRLARSLVDLAEGGS